MAKSNGNGIKIGIIVVCLLAVGAIFFVQSGGLDRTPPPVRASWFMDLATGKPYLQEIGDDQVMGATMPPVEGLSGKTLEDGSLAGVRLYVFGCGSCDDASAQFSGYVEKYTAEEKRRLENRPPIRRNASADGTLVASIPESGDVSDLDWRTLGSAGGKRIINAVHDRCPGEQLITCQPNADQLASQKVMASNAK